MRLLLAAALLAGASPARAWGPRGHDAVVDAAVQLLEDRQHPLARFLAPNAAALRELTQAPDAAWQLSGASPSLPPGRLKRLKEVDAAEHPLHLFEADAFVDPSRRPDAIARLPAGEYRKAYPDYQKLLADAGRGGDPTAHGSAPWRVLQLYDLSVDALRRKDARVALLALGAMANYVGEMSQPFNTTRDYDEASPSAGACSAFEAGIVDAAKGPLLASETLAAAQAALPAGDWGLVPRERVVPEVLLLVDSGYPEVRRLLDAYEALGTGGRAPSGQPTPRFLASFAAAALPADAPHGLPKTTVLAAAERRLGAGAALLARLWASAYDAAGTPELGAQPVDLAGADLLALYPAPDYLPAAGPGDAAPAGDATSERVFIPPASSRDAEPITRVDELLADKKGHEGKVFCLAGKASYVVQRDSKKGSHYFTLWLHDAGQRVKVFGHGYPNFAEGDVIEACGFFQERNRVGPQTFFDEFTAQAVLKGRAIHAGWVRLEPGGVRLLRAPETAPPPPGP